uniref:Gamma-glutamylaminecyclotransferase n=1 Tax=Cricetulus griseus TaxID=10029 RepID=A0A8C2LWQ5_CRIGR
MAHIFVYGTLKRGQPNHKVMLDQSHGSAVFQGRGCTVESFPLVIAGEHNIPWLLHVPGKGHRLNGGLITNCNWHRNRTAIFSSFFLIRNLLHKTKRQRRVSADGMASLHTTVKVRHPSH